MSAPVRALVGIGVGLLLVVLVTWLIPSIWSHAPEPAALPAVGDSAQAVNQAVPPSLQAPSSIRMRGTDVSEETSKRVALLPASLPADFDGLSKMHRQPAPYDLQVKASKIAATQKSAMLKRLETIVPDSPSAALEQQDAAYMLRLLELAEIRLLEGRGILSVEGLQPESSEGMPHYFQFPTAASVLGRYVGVVIDVSDDEELLTYDRACRDLRRSGAALRAADFNRRNEGDRRAIVEEFLRRMAAERVADWSKFGLEDRDVGYLRVDRDSALLLPRR